MGKVDLKTIQDLNNPTINECPYCGCDVFYYKQHMVGNGYMYMRFDKEETDNGDMHEPLRYTPIGKFAYCHDCDKRVFRFRK